MTQEKFEKLLNAFEHKPSEKLANKIAKSRDLTDLYVALDYPDALEIIDAHWFDEDPDSPDGWCLDITECMLKKNADKFETYDAGALYNYVSAVKGAEFEIGMYGKDIPKMYDMSANRELGNWIDDLVRHRWDSDYSMLIKEIEKLPRYKGRFLKSVW